MIGRSILAGVFISVGAICYLNNPNIIGATLFSIGIMAVIALDCPLYTGKIGFVNENMEVIFYPEYSKILNYSKQSFYVIELNSNNHLLKQELIFSDGSKLDLDIRTNSNT